MLEPKQAEEDCFRDRRPNSQAERNQQQVLQRQEYPAVNPEADPKSRREAFGSHQKQEQANVCVNQEGKEAQRRLRVKEQGHVG